VNDVEVAPAGIDAPGWLQRCRSFAAAVLDLRQIDGWELSILLTDDLKIRELNRRYRSIDAPTDVLSFSQDDNSAFPVEGATIPAGDIVISLETMSRNARAHSIPEEEELKRLLIHGILHLEGMDHEEERSGMMRLQESILSSLKEERIF
jgi:probable rRNA maturation factor